MGETQAQIGYGVLIQREVVDASPASFQTIIEMHQIGSFGSKRPLEKATHFQSPGGREEYVLGLKDGVELKLEGNFRPDDDSQSVSAGVIADHDSGTRRKYRIVLPDPFGSFTFDGLVTGWETSVSVDKILMVSFSIKLTGDIEYTPVEP